MPFVKVDSELLESSLWPLRPARDLFLTMLMMAKPIDITEPMTTYKVGSNEEAEFSIPPGTNYGFVGSSGSGIARRAVVSEEEWEEALEELAGPDLESRNPRFDGRRIARVKGGFVVLNYGEYRDKDYSTPRVQKFRERKREAEEAKAPEETPLQNTEEHAGTRETQAEAEGRSIGSVRTAKTVPTKGDSKKSDEQWWQETRENPAFKTLDIDVEIGKAKAWLSTRPGRQFTRRFFVGWLNKAVEMRRELKTPTGYAEQKPATQPELDKLENELVKRGVHHGVFRDELKNLRFKTPGITIAQLRSHFLPDDSSAEIF